MGEIGLGAVRVSEIFLEITPKSSGGPPTNSSALKEFSISRKLNTQRHEIGTGSAQGRPRNMYKRSASESSSTAMYMQGKERTLPKEHHGLLHTLSHRDSDHNWIACTMRSITGSSTEPSLLALHHGQQRTRWCFIIATTQQGLIVTLTARTAPRAATNSVVLYRSNHLDICS